MRLAVLPLALVLAVAATPAAAQIVINGSRQASDSQRDRGAPSTRSGWSGELRGIDRDADRAEDNGQISRREERSIHRQTSLIRSLGARYAASGLSEAELNALEGQAFALRDMVQAPNRPQRRGR
jgi:hypothetical protein